MSPSSALQVDMLTARTWFYHNLTSVHCVPLYYFQCLLNNCDVILYLTLDLHLNRNDNQIIIKLPVSCDRLPTPNLRVKLLVRDYDLM